MGFIEYYKYGIIIHMTSFSWVTGTKIKACETKTLDSGVIEILVNMGNWF